jgi:D-aminopeptidase
MSTESESNKITVEESEKLKELVRTVKNMEAASEEAVAGGGAKIEDSMLDRAKRAVDSYTKYLAEKYKEPAESFITNLETNTPAKVEVGESGPEVELLSGKSPTNVEDKSK